MGGRGSVSHHAKRGRRSVQPEIERNYELLSSQSLQGGATYAFLEQTGRTWPTSGIALS